MKKIEKGEKFLPIGTVVMLENGKKRVMITGFCAIEGNDRKKFGITAVVCIQKDF